MPYGFRLLECLLTAGARVQLLYSSAAQIVAKQECALALPSQPREAVRVEHELVLRWGEARDVLDPCAESA